MTSTPVFTREETVAIMWVLLMTMVGLTAAVNGMIWESVFLFPPTILGAFRVIYVLLKNSQSQTHNPQ